MNSGQEDGRASWNKENAASIHWHPLDNPPHMNRDSNFIVIDIHYQNSGAECIWKRNFHPSWLLSYVNTKDTREHISMQYPCIHLDRGQIFPFCFNAHHAGPLDWMSARSFQTSTPTPTPTPNTWLPTSRMRRRYQLSDLESSLASPLEFFHCRSTIKWQNYHFGPIWQCLSYCIRLTVRHSSAVAQYGWNDMTYCMIACRMMTVQILEFGIAFSPMGRVPRSVVGSSLSLHTEVVGTGVGSVGEGEKKVCGTCFVDSLVLALCPSVSESFYLSPPCHLLHRIWNEWYFGILVLWAMISHVQSTHLLPPTVLCILQLAVTMTGQNCIRYADRGLAIGWAEKNGSIAVRMCCTDNPLRHDATIWQAKISGVTGEDWDDVALHPGEKKSLLWEQFGFQPHCEPHNVW